MNKEKEYWLKEQIKTCRNLCDISLLLIEQKKDSLLPTVLEILYIEIQEIVDTHCVVSDGKS